MDMPAPEAGPTRLGGCRNGYPIRGGITPMPRVPADGFMPPPDPINPPGPKLEKGREPTPSPWPVTPGMEDIRPDIGDRLKEARLEPIAEAPRDGIERRLPPPIR